HCGDGMLFLAGGVESMTRAPFVMAKAPSAWNRSPELVDSTIGWRFINKKLSSVYHPFSMGETAENVAERWKISREAQDLFAVKSQEKYFAAAEAGKFSEEIVPLLILGGKEEQIYFSVDEHPRR